LRCQLRITFDTTGRAELAKPTLQLHKLSLQRAVVIIIITVVLFYFCGGDITEEQTVYTEHSVGYNMQISASLLSLKFLTEKQLQNHYFNL
jgi:hypothetical protein